MQHDWHSECGQLLDEARQAIAWVKDPGNERVLGPERGGAEKGLRRLVPVVAKLDRAVDRPACVGIFGPSQAGKSYLVSVLASGTGQSLRASFAGQAEPIDFLKEINPGGERESTGVVTRFSCRPRTTPEGFPVCLRLLSEADIIKILGNSAFLDSAPGKGPVPDTEAIRAALAAAEARRQPAAPGDNRLTTEDIWDIQDYFERSFEGARALEGLRSLWDELAELAPRLSLADRAELFAFLWGGLPQFTAVYRELVGALARLGFAAEAYCPMDALLPRSESIIDVQTLAGLGRPDQQDLRITSARGTPITLPRPVVTALVAELHITMTSRPWPFLEHTDLLDFPGARARQRLDLAGFLADESRNPLKETFLRGKVAYLFDRYVAEQELTTMLLCIKPSTQEVTDLPDMIDRWISMTHGSTPQKRAGKAVALFLVLTWFDTHFVDKAGEELADPGDRFKGRLSSSIEGFFAKAHDWPNNWVPGAAFTNVFWFRNPSYPAESIMQYDDRRREIGLRADRAEYVERLRAGYLNVPSVRRYFADPGRAFDEGLRPNDGGVSYLAERLEPICRPELKQQQVAARFETLCEQLLDLVGRFHVSTDVEKRLEERRAVAQQILTHVGQLFQEARFGDLLTALLCSEHLFSEVLYSAYTRRSKAPEHTTAASTAEPPHPPAIPRPTPGLPPLPGLPPMPGLPPRPGHPAANPAHGTGANGRPAGAGRSIPAMLARAAVEFWINGLRAASESDALGQYFRGDPRMARELVNELTATARRTGLEDAVAAAMERLAGNISESADTVLEKAAFACATTINGFVTHFRFGEAAPAARPLAPNGDGQQVPLFTRPAAANCARELALPPGHQEYDALSFWMYGFHAVVEDNAKSQDGLDIDITRNAALGSILDHVRRLGAPSAQRG